jgi:hypothetical protein
MDPFMPDRSLRSALFGTFRGRITSLLLIIALLLGIVELGISIATGFYNLQRTRAEAVRAETEAAAASQPMGHLRP